MAFAEQRWSASCDDREIVLIHVENRERSSCDFSGHFAWLLGDAGLKCVGDLGGDRSAPCINCAQRPCCLTGCFEAFGEPLSEAGCFHSGTQALIRAPCCRVGTAPRWWARVGPMVCLPGRSLIFQSCG